MVVWFRRRFWILGVQKIFYVGCEVLYVDGFGQVVIVVGGKEVLFVVLYGVGGEGDEGDVVQVWCGFDGVYQVQVVGVGQLDVDQYDVGVCGVQLCLGFVYVGGFVDDEVVGFQYVVGEFEVEGVVVDDEGMFVGYVQVFFVWDWLW